MMRSKPLVAAATLAAALAILLCVGCDSAKKPANVDAAPSAPKAAEPPKQASACEIVTQSEMSAILGVAIEAKDTTHSAGETACTYSAPSGFPTVQMEVDWGDGEAAMGAFAMLNRNEPGIGSPYDGVGDQAVAIGPTLMIRTGEDLMKLVFSGVDDAPTKAKKIFQTAKPRLSP
jgi:hypothetical protein